MNVVEVFEKVHGNTFVGIDTCTTVTLRGGKSNPMQGRVEKHQKGSTCQVFQNQKRSSYGDMVKRRLKAEGKDPESFKLSPRRWGNRVPNLPLVIHKGELYLEVIFLKAGEVTYTLDGRPIAEDMIEGLPPKPEKTGQGGLDNQVVIRTFKLSSIVNVRLDKKEYRVTVNPVVELGAVNIVNFDEQRVAFTPVASN